MTKLRAGDLVEVRSKEEILSTLDSKGQLRGMPFMPEMFQHCGKQFRVFRSVHKACDISMHHGTARWLGNAVCLEGVRCGGESHGGCQAQCMIFWWYDWLKAPFGPGAFPRSQPADIGELPHAPKKTGCTEEDVMAGTMKAGVGGVGVGGGEAEPIYVCQVTEFPHASRFLHWWDLRQYVADYRSGNVGLWELLGGFVYASFFHLSKLPGIRRAVVSCYDKFQSMVGGVEFPRKEGRIAAGQKTPDCSLGLKPGELVRVKTHDQILDTINHENRNRGLRFDAEQVPYCGKPFRVSKRVSRIIEERTGKMLHFKADSIMLEDVYCKGWYSNNRLFCPRASPCFWKEAWLERADEKSAAPQGTQTGATLTVDRQPPGAR